VIVIIVRRQGPTPVVVVVVVARTHAREFRAHRVRERVNASTPTR